MNEWRKFMAKYMPAPTDDNNFVYGLRQHVMLHMLESCNGDFSARTS